MISVTFLTILCHIPYCRRCCCLVDSWLEHALGTGMQSTTVKGLMCARGKGWLQWMCSDCAELFGLPCSALLLSSIHTSQWVAKEVKFHLNISSWSHKSFFLIIISCDMAVLFASFVVYTHSHSQQSNIIPYTIQVLHKSKLAPNLRHDFGVQECSAPQLLKSHSTCAEQLPCSKCKSV